jgi:putative serine protease PepD
MAVGNPHGQANTVTTRLDSAREPPVSTTEDGSSDTVVTNAIQIDAAVNPGNSGGPLFDAQGKVIGITSSIATTSSESGSIGLGFAIPVNLADMIAGQLIEDGTAEHAFLGVGLTDNTATADGVTRAGAQVQTVTSGSPAASAGIKEGDVIVAIDGKSVAGAESLTGYVRAYASGDKVTLTLVRDGTSLDVDVTLAVREETTSSDSGSGSGDSGSTDPRNMTPDELWQWFQQQQGGGQN